MQHRCIAPALRPVSSIWSLYTPLCLLPAPLHAFSAPRTCSLLPPTPRAPLVLSCVTLLLVLAILPQQLETDKHLVGTTKNSLQNISRSFELLLLVVHKALMYSHSLCCTMKVLKRYNYITEAPLPKLMMLFNNGRPIYSNDTTRFHSH